ncbi:FlgO family outer membrane protein [Psychromonas sp. SP041]|uniref:FlgO family outer membrane protein n=1 Tax=Psychromonas sp. SP041 TaxID=1365007 RepID=UPI0003F9B306|nr:FlgO family outer membrane protein [Psychromonas sp. SP041]
MKKLLVISTLVVMLQGCTSPDSPLNQESAAIVTIEEARANDNYLYYYVAHSFSNGGINNEGSDQADVQTDSSGYGHLYTFNGKKSLILSEVVSKMADQLLFNYEVPFGRESIALTSLVDLNDHNNTSWLGQTISEQFFHELHIRKLRVIDYKLMGNIKVTNDGEFGMTRNWKNLKKNVDVSRILTGTLSRNEEGVIVNVRIVNAINNVVESTSSAFIPHKIFVDGRYDYTPKRYISRNSERDGNQSLVRLVE